MMRFVDDGDFERPTRLGVDSYHLPLGSPPCQCSLSVGGSKSVTSCRTWDLFGCVSKIACLSHNIMAPVAKRKKTTTDNTDNDNDLHGEDKDAEINRLREEIAILREDQETYYSSKDSTLEFEGLPE